MIYLLLIIAILLYILGIYLRDKKTKYNIFLSVSSIIFVLAGYFYGIFLFYSGSMSFNQKHYKLKTRMEIKIINDDTVKLKNYYVLTRTRKHNKITN